MEQALIVPVVIVIILGIVAGYKLGVLVERIRWNDLIKEGYIRAPKKA